MEGHVSVAIVVLFDLCGFVFVVASRSHAEQEGHEDFSMKKKKEPCFTHFSAAEKDCLRRLQDEGKSPSQVAELLNRIPTDSGCVCGLLLFVCL